MKDLETKQNIKMNLTLEREFYELLQKNAKQDFVKVATWTKQFLMKNLSGDKTDQNCLTKNGTAMEV